jgi:hypothetical protein
MTPQRSRINRSERTGGAYRQHSGTIARRAQDMRQGNRSALSDALTRALAARRYGEAMTRILNLIELEPHEPRWHQKYGEVLRTLGRNREAAAAYRRAARRYEALALPVRASAALRVADGLDGGDSSPQIAPRSSDRVPSTPAVVLPEERITERPPRS